MFFTSIAREPNLVWLGTNAALVNSIIDYTRSVLFVDGVWSLVSRLARCGVEQKSKRERERERTRNRDLKLRFFFSPNVVPCHSLASCILVFTCNAVYVTCAPNCFFQDRAIVLVSMQRTNGVWFLEISRSVVPKISLVRRRPAVASEVGRVCGNGSSTPRGSNLQERIYP